MADERSSERGQPIHDEATVRGQPIHDEATVRGFDPHETPTQVHRVGPAAGPTAPRGGESVAPESPAAFRQAVLDSGLVEPAAFDALALGVGDVTELARVLVRAGKLTAYQAGAVVQGKSKGLVIGRYMIRDRLGAGGMGVVFKARKRGDDRDVALKILPPSFNRDPDAVARFRREVEVASRLQHPNIVSALDADEDRGMQFMVMAYVEGRDLERLVRERGPRPVGQALDAAIQAARGLAAAHAAGIVHRDIKPGNLMLDGAGVVRVLDLGLARIIEGATPFGQQSGAALTQSGSYMGTVDYMPPEQAEDSRRVDHRADIYSLGCTLYFLLAGRPPFEGESVLKRLMAHQERPAPSLRSARGAVPEALDEVYLSMMAKRPADRPATMEEVVARLEACRAEAEAASARRELKVFGADSLKSAAERPGPSTSVFAEPKPGDGPRVDLGVLFDEDFLDGRAEEHHEPGATSPDGNERAGVGTPWERVKGSRKPGRRALRPAPAFGVLAAVAALALLGAEATGVADVRGTVLRLFSPEGTLVVEVDDPSVRVKIDGSDVSMTGAAAQEVRLKTGRHTVEGVKDGRIVARELVTITQDGKRVVRVGRDAPPSVPSPVTRAGADASTADLDLQRIAALPAAEQVEEVGKELMRRNPGFDGKVEPTIESGVVAGLKFSTVRVTDISPVRALAALAKLNIGNYPAGSSKLAELTSLEGLPLVRLEISGTNVSDLSSLMGKKLERLQAMSTAVSDLSALRGMPLKQLDLHGARVTSIDPLEGLPLEYLNLSKQRVTDLKALRGMTSLRSLNLVESAVVDLSPLKGLKLRELFVSRTQVSDLTPLQGMKLRTLAFNPKAVTKGLEVVRGMNSLDAIGIDTHAKQRWAPAEFWARYDRGEFSSIPRGEPPLPVKPSHAGPDPDVVRRLNLRSLEGHYRHEPMKNDWHEGRITREGRAGANGGPVYRWSNRAGKTWRVNHVPGTLTLRTGPDNPYARDERESRHRFLVVLKTDGDGSYLPEVAGFWFDSSFYGKVAP